MSNEELFDFVKQENTENKHSFLSEFEAWKMDDLEKASEYYDIPMDEIFAQMDEYGIYPTDDVVVFDGEIIYSTSLSAWADSVRERLRQLASVA